MLSLRMRVVAVCLFKIQSRPGSDSIYVLSLAWRKLSLALAKSDFLKWSSMCPVVVSLTSPHTQSTPQILIYKQSIAETKLNSCALLLVIYFKTSEVEQRMKSSSIAMGSVLICNYLMGLNFE